MKLYKCEICGNLLEVLEDSNKTPICCNKEMAEILENKTENEKHTPVFEIKENEIVVKVGKVLHPMKKEHLIQWIEIDFGNMKIRKTLKVNNQPEAIFPKISDKFIIRAYCNKHGLWTKENC